jgi:non-heme chloroperoxidase
VLIHGWPLSGESWDDQVPALTAAGLRAVRYDRRGFGRSEKTRSGYDYDTLAGDLDKVITELDLTDASLVGFSMGGGEVARYISRYGEQRLRSVVFAAAVTPYMAQTEDIPDGPLTKDLADEMTDGLTKVTVPTLVVHGDGDATVPFEGSGARTHAAIPHSTLEGVQGAPHGLNVSHRDAFNDVLTAFLSR